MPIFTGSEPVGPEVHAEVDAVVVHLNGLLGENLYLTGASVTVADFFIFNNLAQLSMDSTYAGFPAEAESLKTWSIRMKELPSVDANHKPFVALNQKMKENNFIEKSS